ncbi:hypothetical protein [Viscerimonas tarda]
MNWMNKKSTTRLQSGYNPYKLSYRCANCGAVTVFAFLFFLFLPATAHAQGGLGPNDNFAISNSPTIYATLEEAVENLEDTGGTITMLQDVNLLGQSASLLYSKTYTIDFGGKTLDNGEITIYAGKVTFKNGATTGVNINVYFSELIVESGSYTGQDNAITSSSGGKVTIIVGAFSCTNDVSGDGCLVTDSDGEIVMADGSTANPANWATVKATTVTVTRTSTGIGNIAGAKAIVSESYYDLTGKPASATAKGFVIRRTVYDDGSVINSKALVK